MTPEKDTTNRNYIFGDYDKDGTKNIDDAYPFDKTRKQTSQEIKLSRELKEIDRIAKNHNDYMRRIVSIVKSKGFIHSARIKSPNSIINKLSRKAQKDPTLLRDFGGVRVYAKSREDAERIASDVIEALWNNGIEAERTENKFNTNKSYYRAIHIDARFEDKVDNGKSIYHYIEIQVLSKGMAKLAHKGHTFYKEGKLTPDVEQKLLEEGKKKYSDNY